MPIHSSDLASGLAIVLISSAAIAGDVPKGHPSQHVSCNQVDNFILRIPHGDGVPPVTDDETGPGGWRFSSSGRSFVTFDYDLVGDAYVVNAGRSNVASNTGIINDYPATLDLPQNPEDDVLTFKGPVGVITLVGGDQF